MVLLQRHRHILRVGMNRKSFNLVGNNNRLAMTCQRHTSNTTTYPQPASIGIALQQQHRRVGGLLLRAYHWTNRWISNDISVISFQLFMHHPQSSIVIVTLCRFIGLTHAARVRTSQRTCPGKSSLFGHLIAIHITIHRLERHLTLVQVFD